MRLILEIEGETVVEARCGIGYLHTGIEKNLEYRTWTQGVTFVTRMDYLSPFSMKPPIASASNDCWASPTDPAARLGHRVMLMGSTASPSHLVALATGGMELGAMTPMFFGFRERELILTVFEAITGLRMNNAYIRPGPGCRHARRRAGPGDRAAENPARQVRRTGGVAHRGYIWKARTQGWATST